MTTHLDLPPRPSDARPRNNPRSWLEISELHYCQHPGNVRTIVGQEAESLDAWFKREILCHEPALFRYLMRVWPRKDEVPYLRQETYARVYQAAASSRPTSPRAFLFTTAHHLMSDRIRHERVVSIEAVGDIETLGVSSDEISVEASVSARDELRHLAAALDRLPPRCREVVWLRRVDGLSQKETAAALGISVKAVEEQMSRGGRLLAEYMLSTTEEDGGPKGRQSRAGLTRGPRRGRERG